MHVAIGMIERTRCGYMIAHSSTCIPPIEPPTTACQQSTPRWSASLAWARTMSRMVSTGKREAYGRPSAGCGDAGPVEPWQPPRTLAHTTNQRSVSIARPGPTIPSHQPGVGCPRPAGPVTWLSPVQAWHSRMALAACSSSVPHVS